MRKTSIIPRFCCPTFFQKKSDTRQKPLQKPAGACRTARRSFAVGAGGSPPILILTILFGGGAGAPAPLIRIGILNKPRRRCSSSHALRSPETPFRAVLVSLSVPSGFALQKLLGTFQKLSERSRSHPALFPLSGHPQKQKPSQAPASGKNHACGILRAPPALWYTV